MKTIEQITSDFEQIFSEILKINGISEESAVQVSAVILQELGKYNRSPDSKNGNGDTEFTPATFQQKKAMKNLKLSFPENISKAEASRVIEIAVERFRGNGKGRDSPAFSPYPK